MASSINASTSGPGGVITTADNSGILNLQSGGNTVATVGPSGLSTPTGSTINTANTFGFKNRIINGSFNINQYNLGTVTPTTNQYIIDRWQANVTTASKYSVAQSSTAAAGFTNSALITSTSPYSVVAGDYETFQHRIEANNMADMGWGTTNAKTTTLSFWVQSSLTGTFGGSLYFPASTTRTYPFSYTISSANTWQQISITVPGDTVANTAPTGTNLYVIINWSLGAGSTYTTGTSGWQNGNFASPTGCVNLIGTSGATLYITGAQLELGAQATSFDQRSIGTELGLCQRYYYASANGAFVNDGQFTYLNGSNLAGAYKFGTTMRAQPTITVYNGSTANQVLVAGSSTTSSVSGTNLISQSGFGGIQGSFTNSPFPFSGFNITASAEL